MKIRATIKHLKNISLLTLGPSDTLVVKFSTDISAHEQTTVAADIQSYLGLRRILVLGPNCKLSVLRKTAESSTPQPQKPQHRKVQPAPEADGCMTYEEFKRAVLETIDDGRIKIQEAQNFIRQDGYRTLKQISPEYRKEWLNEVYLPFIAKGQKPR